jgi:hypothetical protein
MRLSPQEFELLQYLYERSGQTCSREELGEHLWGFVEVGGKRVPRFDDHMLHALVYRLRGKMRRAGVDLSQYLTSVPGSGYRLETTPRVVEGEPPDREKGSKRVLLRWAVAGAGAAAGLVLTGAAVAMLVNGSDRDDASASVTPVPVGELCGAEMISPEPGSTLSGSTVTFKWTAGCGMTKYDLWVGCSPSDNSLFDAEDGTLLEVTVDGLPTDGGPVFVWLTSSDGTEEGFFRPEYEYKAADDGGEVAAYLPGTEGWIDTGIQFTAGQPLGISACGQVIITSEGYPAFHAEGNPECPGVWRYAFPAPDLPCWSLIGRIDDGEPFFIGTSLQIPAVDAPGHLYIGINEDHPADNLGGFRATIRTGP